MKRMARTLAFVAALMLILSAAACAPAPAPTPAPAAPTAAPAAPSAAPAAPTAAPAAPTAAPAAPTAAAPAPTAAPAAAAPVKLTYWLVMDTTKVSPIYTNYGDAPIWGLVEKATNTEIEFLHPAAGQEKEQFNVLVSSNSLPDMFDRDMNDNYPGGADKAIKDGVIFALNDLMDKAGPNVKKMYADHPDWEKNAKTDQGNFYAMPFIRAHDFLLTSSSNEVRKDWVQALNIDIDTVDTVKEYYDLLSAIKKAGYCEFPMLFSNLANFWGGNIMPGGFDVGGEWYLEKDGKIHYGPAEPAFKDFITEMAKWYKEGIINPDFETTLDTAKVRAAVLDNKAALLNTNIIGGMGYYYDTYLSTHPDDKELKNFSLTGVKYPGPAEGVKSRFGSKDLPVAGMGNAISTNCKNPEAAMRFLDYGYGEEGDLLFNFGVEGTSFNYAKVADAPYDKSILDLSKWGDTYPKYTDNIVNPDPKAPGADPKITSMTLAMTPWMRSHMGGSFMQDARYLLQSMKYKDQTELIPRWQSNTDWSGLIYARLYYTDEEAKVRAAHEADLATYRDEALTAFITGKRDMKEWDAFVSGLKDYGLDKVLEVRNASYARAIAR